MLFVDSLCSDFDYSKLFLQLARLHIMRSTIIILFCLSLLSTSVQANESEYVILRSREAGMFSIFDDIAAVLKKYDRGSYNGVEIDFDTTGPYYDTEYGSNWWQYYCEPIVLGSSEGCAVRDSRYEQQYSDPWETELRTTRKEVNELIKKYIRFKPHITEKIDNFCEENFNKSFVFGIHYRGTDKSSEAPRVNYKKASDIVKYFLKAFKFDNYKIFIATDEQAFIDFMTELYGDRVIYMKDAARSLDGKPLHLDLEEGQYKQGEEALCDCYLLSRTHLLIRTSSNLSRWSTYFNPKLPVIPISDRY